MAKTVVALDCMGGDYAPEEPVKGAVEALREKDNVFIKLVGQTKLIEDELKKYDDTEKYSDSYEIIDAPDVIDMAEPPVTAIREKTESSLVKCLYAVRHGEADGMVSAGSSGAVLVGGHLVIGRLKGVQRPPFAPLLPTAKKKPVLLLDAGANVDVRASMLLQFAQIGTVYMENILGFENPKVGLVSVGTEEEKGNALTKEAFPMFKEAKGINFIGNIEARDIPEGKVDIAVCDAFVGNAILKTYEGVGAMILNTVIDTLKTNLKTKIGALLIKKQFKKSMKAFDIKEYGGAPLLGLKGLLMKTHGNSKAVEIKNSIFQCIDFNELDLNNKIKERLNLND